jgi:Holliday junction DNA helicase RuvA
LITRIRGLLEKVTENKVELACGDLVYEVLVPTYLGRGLRLRQGEQVELYVQHYLEGGSGHASMIPRLVGFLNEADRGFYQMLVKVPGLGARTALKAMVIPPREMAGAIEREDKNALSGLPGVGRRTADKIVASLKGKLLDFAFEAGEPRGPAGPWTEMEEEALLVLLQLQYKRSEAEQLIIRARRKHPDLADAEALCQAVFKEAGSKAIK